MQSINTASVELDSQWILGKPSHPEHLNPRPGQKPPIEVHDREKATSVAEAGLSHFMQQPVVLQPELLKRLKPAQTSPKRNRR